MERIESFEDGRKEEFSILREQKVSVTHNGKALGTLEKQEKHCCGCRMLSGARGWGQLRLERWAL